MSVLLPIRRALAVLSLAVLAGCAAAPAKYEPTSGQAGKDVVWVPTPQALVDRMLEMAKVTPRDYVMDLGSGDGRTVITAAKLGATAVGIEYNPDMVELSKRNAAREGVKATFLKADLFETDFSPATVITMFLLPSINLKLRPALLKLKPGTRIVSNSFTMDTWEPDRTDTIPYETCGGGFCTAHLWIVPADFAGTHSIPQGRLVLEQRFQVLSGRLESANGVQEISGKVDGEEAYFTIAGKAYRARMKDGKLVLQ